MRTFLTYLCLAVTGIMISAPCVRANGCRAGRAKRNNVVVVKKVVAVGEIITPAFVAVPIVPVVLLQGAYYQPPPPQPVAAVTQVTKRTVTVPGATAVGGESVSATNEMFALLKEIRGEILTQRADIAALKAHTKLGAAVVPAPGGVVNPPPPSPEPKAPAPKEIGDQVEQAFATLAKKNCAICHGLGNEAFAGPNKFIMYDSYGQIRKFNNDDLLEISKRVSDGSMPKINARSRAAGITELSDTDLTVVQAWINKRAGENRKAKAAPAAPAAPPVPRMPPAKE